MRQATKRKGTRKQTFDFKTELAKGQQGEEVFEEMMKLEGIEVWRLDGRRADFVARNGKLIEVKTDYHDNGRIFVERYSVFPRTSGGPWQSRRKQVDLFCYLIGSRKKRLLVFNTKELIKRMEKLDKEHMLGKLIFIKNKGYNTAGWALPIEYLEYIHNDGLLREEW